MSGDDRPLRLFLALDLPDAHREALGRYLARAKARLPPARWVPTENLHATLVFLGATDPERLPDLTAALHPACAAVPRFETALTGAGTFPPRRPARVAWIGLRSGPELNDLRRGAAESAARALGMEPGSLDGRRFHAHVTVARPRRPWNRRAQHDLARAYEEAGGEDRVLAEPFEVTEGVLYRSELGPGGARYSAIERFPLGPAPSDVPDGTDREPTDP